MSTQPEYDVVISGAGPAGAHTALRLAREGWRVCLLDSRVFPRTKPCGEFLSPACLPILDELGLLEPLREAGGASVAGMNLHASKSLAMGSYVALGPFSASHGHGIGIRREVLDTQALRAVQREATATVLEGWRVSRPITGSDGRVVGLAVVSPDGERSEIRARLSVGADGLRSRVARELGWVKRSEGTGRMALMGRYSGVPVHRNAEVHFLGRDYFGACPIDEGLFTANLVLDADALRLRSGSLGDLFHDYVRRAPALEARLAGAQLVEPITACGPLRLEVRRCVAPGVALVGDACGFVDPLTGEGVFMAMRGARLLARALGAALSEPQREAALLRAYAWRRKLEFGPRYTVSRLLQLGLRRPGVSDRAVRLLSETPGLFNLSMAWTGDYLPPSGLFLPQVWRSAAATAGRSSPVA